MIRTPCAPYTLQPVRARILSTSCAPAACRLPPAEDPQCARHGALAATQGRHRSLEARAGQLQGGDRDRDPRGARGGELVGEGEGEDPAAGGPIDGTADSCSGHGGVGCVMSRYDPGTYAILGAGKGRHSYYSLLALSAPRGSHHHDHPAGGRRRFWRTYIAVLDAFPARDRRACGPSLTAATCTQNTCHRPADDPRILRGGPSIVYRMRVMAEGARQEKQRHAIIRLV